MDENTIALMVALITAGGVFLLAYVILRAIVRVLIKLFRKTGPQQDAQQATETPIPQNTEKKVSFAQSLLTLILCGGVLWFFLSGGLEQKVATDSVTQYGIAQRNGTAIDHCVQAGLVTAAYLQAQDETNYKKWKAIENNDCASAGVPQ